MKLKLSFYFLLCSGICFAQNRSLGGPEFSIIKMPGDVLLAKAGSSSGKAFNDTIRMCASENFSLVLLSGNCGGGSCRVIQWKKDGIDIPGATTNTLFVYESGKYSVVVNCGSSYISYGDLLVEKYAQMFKWPGDQNLQNPFYEFTLQQGDEIKLELRTLDNICSNIQWQKNGATINAATSYTLSIRDTGNYSAIVNCASCNNTFFGLYKITRPVQTQTTLYNDFLVYPNPGSDIFYLEMSEIKNTVYTLRDAQGQILVSNTLKENRTPINLSTMSAGIYFLTVSGTNHSQTQKIIKLNN